MSGLQVRATVAERHVDIEFVAAPGEVVAILGPNGAGKSTALHLVAGLLQPDSGQVRLGDHVLTDTAARVFVPAHARRVGMLLQDPLLFPHMSVEANVAFAPRSRGLRRRAARASAAQWLDRVGAADLAGRAPDELSGGQAQRIAIARALAAEPDVLLLDEPLTGLDVAAAAAIRKLLRDVLAAPRSHFAARIAGINLVNGTLAEEGVLCGGDGIRWHGVPDAATPPQRGGPAVAVFAPAAVAVYRAQPHGSPRNTVAVTVAELDGRGTGVRVRADVQPDGAPGLAADITVDAAADLRLAPGERVYFTVKAQEVALHSGLRRAVTT